MLKSYKLTQVAQPHGISPSSHMEVHRTHVLGSAFRLTLVRAPRANVRQVPSYVSNWGREVTVLPIAAGYLVKMTMRVMAPKPSK